jgi:hypothetical protein
MKLGAIDYTTWGHSDLDAAYADAYSAGDSALYTAIGLEIIDRQATKTDFILNIFGSVFPKFDSIQRSKGEFVASEAAPQSVITSAGDLVTKTEAAVASIGQSGMVGLAGAAILALLFVFRKK